ncbi:MAG: AAA family ATPase, partial [Planctomycetia bacterium]
TVEFAERGGGSFGGEHRLGADGAGGEQIHVERDEPAVQLVTAPPGTMFVSRAGESLSAEGGLEIGQPAGATGLVARRSELKSLAARQDELVGTVADATARIERLQADLRETADEIGRARERRQEAAERSASSRAERDRTGRDLVTARKTVEDLSLELVTAERQVLELSAARDSARESLEQADLRLGEARRSLEDVKSDVDTLDRSRVEVLEEIQSLRIAQAASNERLGRARDAVASRSSDLEARRHDLEGLLRGRDELDRRLVALDMDLLATGAVRAETVLAAERAAAALGELDRRAATAALEQARDEATRLSEAIHARELSAGEARHRRARIVERIRDDYDLSIEDIVAREQGPTSPTTADDAPATALQTDENAPTGATPVESTPRVGLASEPEVPADRTELEAEIETLRRMLGSMTSVNLEALAEAEALTERLAGLQAQLDDVTNAKLAIEQLVSKIDDESRRLLGETIETVRGHFRELFERVFGGGPADNVVEADVDLLEAAVEIVARPPGKEPRNISLLSGGEKTMTCVALLLAIFRSRPSPFCVLDEVDAALDEANVDRFAGVLRDFLSSTQFIVVTHSKKTMAAADTLYGVTMEESGVSKRIAVRFEAAVATAHAGRRAA